MFRKILVPTDGSEYARKAFETALNLAKVMDASLLLLHVCCSPETHYGQELSRQLCSGHGDLSMGADLVFKATIGSLDTGRIGIKRKAITGYPAVGILEEAERNKVDLIVMGGYGHGPFRGAVLGSVANRVLTHAVCPVLIIR